MPTTIHPASVPNAVVCTLPHPSLPRLPSGAPPPVISCIDSARAKESGAREIWEREQERIFRGKLVLCPVSSRVYSPQTCRFPRRTVRGAPAGRPVLRAGSTASKPRHALGVVWSHPDASHEVLPPSHRIIKKRKSRLLLPPLARSLNKACWPCGSSAPPSRATPPLSRQLAVSPRKQPRLLHHLFHRQRRAPILTAIRGLQESCLKRRGRHRTYTLDLTV